MPHYVCVKVCNNTCYGWKSSLTYHSVCPGVKCAKQNYWIPICLSRRWSDCIFLKKLIYSQNVYLNFDIQQRHILGSVVSSGSRAALMWHVASSRLIIGYNINQTWNVPNSLPLSDLKRAGILSIFLTFSSSPVAPLRSTKNRVHIPLKEISDANKLFCAQCSGYRVAPKTKLCVTLLTSTKFLFLLPGRHGAFFTDGSACFPLAFEPELRVKKKTGSSRRTREAETEWGAFEQFS